MPGGLCFLCKEQFESRADEPSLPQYDAFKFPRGMARLVYVHPRCKKAAETLLAALNIVGTC